MPELLPSLLRVLKHHKKKSIFALSVLLLYFSTKKGYTQYILYKFITAIEEVMRFQLRRKTRSIRVAIAKVSVIEEVFSEFQQTDLKNFLPVLSKTVSEFSDTNGLLNSIKSSSGEQREKLFGMFLREVREKIALTLIFSAFSKVALFACCAISRRIVYSDGKIIDETIKKVEEHEKKHESAPENPVGLSEKNAQRIKKLSQILFGVCSGVLKNVAADLSKILKSESLFGEFKEINPAEKLSRERLFELINPSLNKLIFSSRRDLNLKSKNGQTIKTEEADFNLSYESPGLYYKIARKMAKGSRTSSIFDQILDSFYNLNVSCLEKAKQIDPSQSEIAQSVRIFLDFLATDCMKKATRLFFEIESQKLFNRISLHFKKTLSGESRIFEKEAVETYSKLSFVLDKLLNEEFLSEDSLKLDREIVDGKLKWAFYVLRSNNIDFKSETGEAEQKEEKFDVMNTSMANFNPHCASSQAFVMMFLREKVGRTFEEHFLKVVGKSLVFEK